MKESDQNSLSISGLNNSRQQSLKQVRQIISAGRSIKSSAYQTGLKLLNITNYEDAAESFQRSIEENPAFSFSHYSLGETLIGLNKFNEAFNCFETALSLNPYHAASYSLLGDVLVKLGNSEKASEMYRQALELKPDLIKALQSFSRLLLNQLAGNEANDLFRRAVKYNPINLQIYREALDCLSPDASLYFEFAEYLAANNILPIATFFFHLAAQISPEASKFRSRLAEFLLQTNDIEGYQICCQRAC